jgi:hypothetical protein
VTSRFLSRLSLALATARCRRRRPWARISDAGHPPR